MSSTDSDPSIDSSEQSSPLLTLTPELRNLIYEHALSSANPICIERRIDPEYRFRVPPLTQTCRLLRNEGLPWFYTRNEFSTTIHSGDLSDLVAWFMMIGEPQMHVMAAKGMLKPWLKYRSLFDMPVATDFALWVQPLTLTIEGIVHAIYGSYMDMDYEPPEARGELILKWICAPGVLETLRRERRPELVAHEPRKQDDEERRVREFPHDELKEKQDRPLSIERLMQHFEED